MAWNITKLIMCGVSAISIAVLSVDKIINTVKGN